MKKYTQIALVIVVLAILVFVRKMKSDRGQAPATTPQPIVSASPTPSPTASSQSQYKDGTYTGSVEDAFYGNFQVAAVITNGKLSDIKFLQYPNDKTTSRQINEAAIPTLRS